MKTSESYPVLEFIDAVESRAAIQPDLGEYAFRPQYPANLKPIDTMPSSFALLIWIVLLLGLLYFDPAKDSDISWALWVPLVWIFIVGSRLPSQWFEIPIGMGIDAVEEGNPLDRTIFSVLILLAIGVLISRSIKWGDFFSRNFALVAFLSFAFLSAIWSDFPLVSSKRWFRDLGNYFAVLVILSDARPVEAIRTLLRRLCYLLIPLSVLIIKYYPETGKRYDPWTGSSMYTGPTTSKNMLGALCLIGGIFVFWDTVTRWPDRKERRTKRIILVNVAFMAMILWLLNLADSATSRVCLAIGCLVILAAHSKTFRRHPRLLKVLIPACFCTYLVLAFGFDINGEMAGAVGRDPTLTDRTVIWNIVLNMHTNPLVGTGYESFWLGPRLLKIWQVMPGINESHNGYLEVYLNLGLLGVLLIVGLLIASYRNICRKLTPFSSMASLSLAFWTVMLFYNMTEAAFRGGLIWVMFLLGAIAVAEPAEERVDGLIPQYGRYGPHSLDSPEDGGAAAIVSYTFEKSSIRHPRT